MTSGLAARPLERQPFFGRLNLAFGGLNVRPFAQRSFDQYFKVGWIKPASRLDGDFSVRDGVVFEIFGETDHRLPEAKFGLPNGGIELDSFEPHFDQIGFRNRAFLKSREIQLNELLKRLPIFRRDFNAAAASTASK